MHLDRWHRVLVDQGAGHGLIPVRCASSAFAEMLSWLGRRVETIASRLLPTPPGKGRFTRCSVSPLTPMMGWPRANPEENRDPSQGISFQNA
jgi:hypothetical protein